LAPIARAESASPIQHYSNHGASIHERLSPRAPRTGHRWLDRASFDPPHHPVFGFQGALANAGALALGYFTTCAVMGISGPVLFGDAGSAISTVGRVIGVAVGALLIVLGLRSLLNAPDPDAQPPGWLESIDSMSPPGAFAFGMALFPLQVKNLAIFVACLELITSASLGARGNAFALGLVLLVFATPVLGLIGLYAAAPQRASTMLGSLRAWMEKNGRTITVVLCFVLGAFFLIRGLSGR
jgi:hypothetical protein